MALTIPGYRLLIKPDQLEKETASGIQLVYENEALENAKQEYGEVVQIGEGCWKDNTGRYIGDAGPWCKVGDRVVYSKYGGKFVTDPEQEKIRFTVVSDQDILAVVTGEK